MDRFSLGTYDGTDLGCTVGTSYCKFEVLLLGASLVSVGLLEVGFTKCKKLGISYWGVLGTTIGIYDGT